MSKNMEGPEGPEGSLSCFEEKEREPWERGWGLQGRCDEVF